MFGGGSKKKEEKKEETKKTAEEEKVDSSKYRGDEFAITIKKTVGDQMLAKGQGSWLSHLEIEGNVIWRID